MACGQPALTKISNYFTQSIRSLFFPEEFIVVCQYMLDEFHKLANCHGIELVDD